MGHVCPKHAILLYKALIPIVFWDQPAIHIQPSQITNSASPGHFVVAKTTAVNRFLVWGLESYYMQVSSSERYIPKGRANPNCETS